MKKVLPLLSVVLLVVFISGCVNFSVEDFAKANPMINQFLKEHPNAKILATHFSKSQSESMIDVIKKDCDNPYAVPKEFYRVTVEDNESGLKIVMWVDWENKIVECIYKEGSTGYREYANETIDNTKCLPHYVKKCYKDDVYWFDSCGNKQEKAMHCDNGCAEGRCIGPECKSHAKFACYGRHVYWFDSCGHVQDKKEYCKYGCENGFCKENKRCEDVGGYCVNIPRPKPILDDESKSTEHSVTGMPVASETTTTASGGEGTAVSVCKEGFIKSDYYCPDNGICCIPKENRFCDVNKDYYEKPDCKCPEGYEMTVKYVCYEVADSSVTAHMVETTESEKKCIDSDGGYNIYESGTVISGEQKLSDHCNSDGSLTEKYCDENGEIKWKTEKCPEGYVCKDAQCVKESSEEKPETSSDTSETGKGECKAIYKCVKKEEPKPVCGNGICEEGEATICPSCTKENPPCETPCKQGTCPEDCKPKEFCGKSTYGKCDTDSDCVRDGCSSQICRSVYEEAITTTCEYLECYNAESFGMICSCRNNACQWIPKEEKKCAKEGQYTSGPVSPEYSYGCCEGLKGFETHPAEWVGAGVLCYDPEKGTPVCKAEGTKSEGWYYSKTGELLIYENCSSYQTAAAAPFTITGTYLPNGTLSIILVNDKLNSKINITSIKAGCLSNESFVELKPLESDMFLNVGEKSEFYTHSCNTIELQKNYSLKIEITYALDGDTEQKTYVSEISGYVA